MKKLPIISLIAAGAMALASCGAGASKATDEEPALKDVFDGKFLIGAAINGQHVSGFDSLGQELVKKHFNTIVAENCMKSEKINPQKGVYDWAPADSFVNFGEANGMFIVGHCLVWHSQLAPWFTVDDNGNAVSADTLKERMRTFITDVVTRYKGRVKGWDVVNEAVMEDGSYRHTPFYDALGEEFIPLAFQYAHEADPDAELYINDYGMNVPGRRDKYVQIVNDLKKRGLRIDAIGMQAHMGMDYPDFGEFEAAIDTFANTGCKVMVTEWDMSALPTIHQSANIAETVEQDPNFNPYPDGLPADTARVWNERMGQVMNILLRKADKVSRVNIWGVIDSDSWKNNWPMKGRTEYPLVFDRSYKMKPFMRHIADSLTNKK